jgi:hypothetical protein
MRKPLHEKSEGVHAILNSMAPRQGHIVVPYKWSDREGILFRNTGDTDFLIETANQYSGKAHPKESSFLPKFGHYLADWMERFVSKGFTTQMLQELRRELGNIRFFHVLNPAIPTRGKPLPHWDYIADTADFTDPRTTAAYAFSQQLTLDGFIGLKRCHLKSCRKFFIGRPNTKWCSDSCGSLHRVRQKRKRDRN